MRFTKDWKASLDNKKLVGTVLKDLSKAFESISPDLLIAKLHAYILTKTAVWSHLLDKSLIKNFIICAV